MEEMRNENVVTNILEFKNVTYVFQDFICRRFFHNEDDFEREKMNLKNLVCGNCHRMFEHQSELFSHMNEHKENRDPVDFVGEGALAEAKKKRKNQSSNPGLKKRRDASKSGSCTLTSADIKISIDDWEPPSPRGSQTLAYSPALGNPLLPGSSTNLEDTDLKVKVQICSDEDSIGFEPEPLKIKLKKRNVSQHNCTRCSKSFIRRNLLEVHCEKEHGTVEIKCDFCPEIFPKLSILKAHESAAHAGEKKFSCQHCGNKYRTKNNLTIHLRLHDKELPMKCLYCEKRFNKTNHKAGHMLSIHNRCDRCPELFDKKEDLLTHLTTHDPENKKCRFCDIECDSHSELALHAKEHTKDEMFYCKICNSKCKTAEVLKAHFARVHGGERRYSCHICAKKFSVGANLRIHISSVHGKDRPFVCEICGKSFATKSSLNMHQKIHDGNQEQFECGICGKKLTTKSGIQEHRLAHATDRQHLCSICGKSFKTPRVLKMHTLSHESEKPFKCGVCNKAFKTQEYVKLHARMHDGERKYVCRLCGEGFVRLDYLKYHVRKKHPTGVDGTICYENNLSAEQFE